MLNAFKELITNQFAATSCTMNTCVDRCPESKWNEPIANLAFCQVTFHTLFFADYHL